MAQRDPHFIMMDGPSSLFADCLVQILSDKGYEVGRGKKRIYPIRMPFLFLWSGDKVPSSDDLYHLRGENITIPLLFFSPERGESSQFAIPKRTNMLCVNMGIAIADLTSSIDAIALKSLDVPRMKIAGKDQPVSPMRRVVRH